MKINNLTVVFFLFMVLLYAGNIFAHPGRTDSSGCHTCRTNCSSWGLSYGEYHCHNAKSLPQPKEPIKSHYGDGGTGYTTPALEYKNSTATVSDVDKIRPRVETEKVNYYKNPHWFRENLIDKINKELGAGRSLIAYYVYTMLVDIK